MKLIFQIVDCVSVAAMSVATLVLFVLGFLTIVVPLAPLITFVVVLFFTLITFARGTTAVLSLTGIVLYAASWPAVAAWGPWPSLLIWMLGILVWFAGVVGSFSTPASAARPIPAICLKGHVYRS